MSSRKKIAHFQYAVIHKEARSSQYAGSLQWIEDAFLDRKVLPEIFKVYMTDIGLLVSMLEEGTDWSILQGNLLGYKPNRSLGRLLHFITPF